MDPTSDRHRIKVCSSFNSSRSQLVFDRPLLAGFCPTTTEGTLQGRVSADGGKALVPV
jgi:hypothetical protein